LACLEGTASRGAACTWSLPVFAEFGAFVGYSALAVARLAPRGARLRSFELDAIHVAVARYITSLARLQVADVSFSVGHAHDLLPSLVEECGARSVAFVFMDHSNSRFHEELEGIERLDAVSPRGELLADNVLKPGAPLFAWATACRFRGVASWPSASIAWAMSEFRHEDQEDWMVVVSSSVLRHSDLVRGPVMQHNFEADTVRSSTGVLNQDLFTWRWSWSHRSSGYMEERT